MHFHTSQYITSSHFPHRHRDDAIREKKIRNYEQTVHHPQTPKKENKNPSLRIREERIISHECRLYTAIVYYRF